MLFRVIESHYQSIRKFLEPMRNQNSSACKGPEKLIEEKYCIGLQSEYQLTFSKLAALNLQVEEQVQKIKMYQEFSLTLN